MIIDGRTFVISGGASGLGQASVRDLHSHGGYVAILDMNEENGETTLNALGKDRARFFQTDVTDTDSIAAAVKGVNEWVQHTGKPIGGVVAAAGVGFPGKIIDRQGNPLVLSTFDLIVNINLRGTVDLCRQLLPSLVANEPLGSHVSPSSPSETDPGDGERGVLILVSSVAAYDGQPGQTAYAATKGAVVSMVLPMARDLAEYGIRVMAIAPGVFESAMTAMMSQKAKKSLVGVMEFPKRMGRPEEFARLVREIISNSMMNAQTIRLDGAIRMPSKM
ncbi:MAG: hypothetical protein M1828_006696 [Chrysothrix sp. TS-e1954]|nr:MAG: hypothetical protein M1828_006696 [Chrysothrix sp. TS-e1954]